ncbi:uncharacterized protein B0I36DRAFT_156503 [Microdochium trichocladiopsis]|uniref:Zn(2)-C6 fungal-type domain-containing protein n=1 Tax=Microdochium trichocladiopsis TaxID=1682393 RepID=A0A9P8Y010_9PEZI|nr:uncharacterized protein B0I36DRAFT_156503 [Microdochium trichocladiopsis]KAH7026299.1 hypothetical protein B0I36DRAFT_156503 [Microdochium trichocladiopsis]
MTSPGPKPRRRRAHKRSRNGCLMCKEKHMRCDERKPLCSLCLVKGFTCEYGTKNDQNACGAQVFTLVQDSLPKHHFVGYPVPMNDSSRFLFHIATRCGGPQANAPHDFILKRAVSQPALLHGALLLSSVLWTWNTGPFAMIERPFIHHKLSTIQFVNQQLQNHRTRTDSRTVLAIVCLVLAESGLGSREIAGAHLRGLAKLMQVRDGPRARKERNALQSVIQMMRTNTISVDGLHSMIGSVDVGNSLGLCAFTLMLKQARRVLQKQGNPALGRLNIGTVLTAGREGGVLPNNMAPLGGVLGGLGFLDDGGQSPTSAIPDKPSPLSSLPSNVESRGRWITCFIAIFATLGPEDTDVFMLSWFVEGLLRNLRQKQDGLFNGSYPLPMFLAAAVFASAAAKTVQVPADMLGTGWAREAQAQIDLWRAEAAQKLQMISGILGITEWTSFRRFLHTWKWDENPREESVVRELWEEYGVVHAQPAAVVQRGSPQQQQQQHARAHDPGAMLCASGLAADLCDTVTAAGGGGGAGGAVVSSAVPWPMQQPPYGKMLQDHHEPQLQDITNQANPPVWLEVFLAAMEAATENATPLAKQSAMAA